MENTKFYGNKTREQSDADYAQMMLNHIEEKYGKDFEIIKYIFPKEGFNTEHLQNQLLVKETQSGTITDVYALLGSPYEYYDHYISDLASWQNQDKVSCDSIAEMGNAKFYLYLRNEDIHELDISAENVSRAVLVVNINQQPDDENLKRLFSLYQQLYALEYEYIFMIAGFTEQCEAFSDYVESYRVYGKKQWEDYDGKVYATLSVREAGMTFEAFKNACQFK